MAVGKRPLSNLFTFFLSFLEISQGKKLKCSTSQAKHKLFIGNVPRNWREEDIKKVVNKVGPGVVAVELLKVGRFFLFRLHSSACLANFFVLNICIRYMYVWLNIIYRIFR